MAHENAGRTFILKIEKLCVGRPVTVEFEGKSTLTSIFKQPVEGPLNAGLQNLDGDEQADLSVHGGRDKSMYAYSIDYYPLWAAELGREQLEDSQFGENLTVSGYRDEQVVVGSTLRFGGDVTAVVTQPRIPCFKLGIRVGDADFPNRFWTTGRLGFYLRVEQTGQIAAGDAMEVVDTPSHGITVRDLWKIVTDADKPAARGALEALEDIDDGWQRRLRQASRA